MNIKKISILSILSATSILLVYAIRIPMFASFLEYDPADIPILIATFSFGIQNGLFLTLVVSIIQGITVSASSGIIGILMHIFSTGTFVIVSGLTFKKLNSRYTVILSLIFGILANVVSMVIWNLVFTPIFLGTPIKSVLDIILPIIVPFNIIKMTINSFLIFILYKTLGKIINKYNY